MKEMKIERKETTVTTTIEMSKTGIIFPFFLTIEPLFELLFSPLFITPTYKKNKKETVSRVLVRIKKIRVTIYPKFRLP